MELSAKNSTNKKKDKIKSTMTVSARGCPWIIHGAWGVPERIHKMTSCYARVMRVDRSQSGEYASPKLIRITRHAHVE